MNLDERTTSSTYLPVTSTASSSHSCLLPFEDRNNIWTSFSWHIVPRSSVSTDSNLIAAAFLLLVVFSFFLSTAILKWASLASCLSYLSWNFHLLSSAFSVFLLETWSWHNLHHCDFSRDMTVNHHRIVAWEFCRNSSCVEQIDSNHLV